MPSNTERKDIAQEWLHNTGTGYTLQKFSVGSNLIVYEDHFESTCYEVDIVNKILRLPAVRSISERRGSLPSQMLQTSVRVEVDPLLSVVVVTVLE